MTFKPTETNRIISETNHHQQNKNKQTIHIYLIIKYLYLYVLYTFISCRFVGLLVGYSEKFSTLLFCLFLFLISGGAGDF